MTLQWIACNLQTGDLIMAMPDLIVDYPITRSLGQYDTAVAHFVVEDAGAGSFPFSATVSPDPSVDWWYSTIPGVCLLACYDEDDVDQTIQWAGFVTARTRNGETNVVDLSLATTEAYLDRRFINADVTYNTGQNAVVIDIVNNHVKGGATEGLPVTIVNVDGDDGAPIQQSYRDADLTSVYEALTQLSALDNGPEWEMRWVWRDDMSGLDLNFYVGDRIGTAAGMGGPAAVFQMPGSIISVNYVEDYSSGKGANGVRAVSPTQGVAPSDFQLSALADGRPRFNYQFIAPDAASTTAKLNRLAMRTVARMANGARSIVLVADRRTAPVFCRDWNLGDDIGYEVGNTSDGQAFIPVFPFTNGLTGTERVVSVQLGEDTISPIAEVGDA